MGHFPKWDHRGQLWQYRLLHSSIEWILWRWIGIRRFHLGGHLKVWPRRSRLPWDCWGGTLGFHVVNTVWEVVSKAIGCNFRCFSASSLRPLRYTWQFQWNRWTLAPYLRPDCVSRIQGKARGFKIHVQFNILVVVSSGNDTACNCRHSATKTSSLTSSRENRSNTTQDTGS